METNNDRQIKMMMTTAADATRPSLWKVRALLTMASAQDQARLSPPGGGKHPFSWARLCDRAVLQLIGVVFMIALCSVRGSAAEVGQFTDDALLQQVTSGVKSLVEAEKESEAEMTALENARAGLVAALDSLKAPLPPKPEAVAALAAKAGESDEAAKEQLTRIEGYAASVERAEDSKGVAALLDAQITLLAKAEGKQQSLAGIATSLQPLLVELQRRVETGVISKERVKLEPAGEGVPEGLAGWAQRLAAVMTNGPAQRAELAEKKTKWTAESKALADMKPSDSKLTSELRADREAARILSQAIDVGKSDLTELAGVEAGMLKASVERTAQISDSERASLDAAARRAADQCAAFEEIERERLGLKAPSKEGTPPGEGHAELRAARQNVLHSQALVAYHQRRIELIERARSVASKLLDEDREASRMFDYALRELVRLRAQLLAAKNGGLVLTNQSGPDAAWNKLVEIALGEAQRRVEIKQLEARLQDVTALETAKLELAREEQESEKLSAELREEESYAALVTETTGQTEDQLLALLAPQGEVAQQLAEAAKDIAAKESLWKKAEAQYQKARQTISLLESPYTQAAFLQIAQRKERLEAECAALKPGEIPADMGMALTPAPPNAERRAESKNARVPLREVAQKEQEKLEAEQTFAKDLLRFFTDLEAGMLPLRAAISNINECARASSEALSAWVLQEKRRYACALELDRRISAYQVPRSRAPRALRQWTSRETVRAAEEARDQFARREATRQQQRKNDLAQLEAIAALRPWAERRYEVASLKVEVIGDPVAHLTQATTPFAQLPQVKRKELEYESVVLESKEASIELFLSVVAPEIRARFEEPLKAFCLERVDGGRVAAEYEEAQAAYEHLMEICATEREALLGAPAALKAAENQRLLRYQATRHLAAMAMHPESAAKIAGTFRAAYGQELQIPDKQEDPARWAGEIFSAEARLLGQRQWIAHVERQLSKLGLETDIGDYRRSASSITTALEAQRNRIADIKAKSETLRKAYVSSVRAELLWNLVAILVIPVVAFVILRLLKGVVRRIERRAQVPPGQDQTEAQRRLQTLTNALGTTFSVIVWAVAGVYILRRLGMNVTPIIASASVAGLAIAFGAQALIRDFFYGFFILLEHQFTVGDVIKLGDTGGVVERMSLRVTTLRDLYGVVHYIPNGTIQQVSNMTQNWSRVVLEVPVAYSSNIDHVIKVLEQALRALREDPRWRRHILEEPTVAGVEQLGDSSVNVRVLVKTAPGKQWDVARDLRRRVKQVFDAEGIVIPFPQRVVHHVYGDEPKERSSETART